MERLKRASSRREWVAACAALLGAVSCGSSLRKVPLGPHAVTAAPPIVVDSPPPPAKVETVPRDPGAPCRWLDGRWEWSEDTWVWSPGAWVVPREQCHFAMPEARWVPAVSGRGLLFYFPGRWYRDSGDAACEQPRACGAAPGKP